MVGPLRDSDARNGANYDEAVYTAGALNCAYDCKANNLKGISMILGAASAGEVWMTKSGYPAIVREVLDSQVTGVVVSPSGSVSCSWEKSGKNKSDHPDFFDIEIPPNQIAHKYAVIRRGALIAACNDLESATKTGQLNSADLICKYSELQVDSKSK